MSAQYEGYRALFEEALKEYGGRLDTRPAHLGESMRYSLFAGGKRLRPVLFFCALQALGQDPAAEKGLAVSLECIHTYSLIHDDLPAMDNDDFRRGKPSCHRAFGEANAILAGDGLLSLAAELALEEGMRSAGHLEAARILFHAAGIHGMVAGQSLDLTAEEDAEAFEEMIARKTGALIAAPLRMAAAIADREQEAFAAYGKNLGRLFQITDDMLDADRDIGRRTAVNVYGADGAAREADIAAEACLAALDGRFPFLQELVGLVRNRTQ